MKKYLIFAVVLSLVFCTPAFAIGIFEHAESDQYGVKAPGMIVRGVGNVGIAVPEMIVHGYEGTVDGMPVLGTIQGIGEGTVWTLERAFAGVWDVATFWVPNYNGTTPTHESEIIK